MPTTGATFTTKQDDLVVGANTVLRWDGTGSTGITGLGAVADGSIVTIVNASTDYLLWLENENTASAAANRFMLPDGFPAFIMPGDTITLWYDGTTQRWRVVSWPTRGTQMGFELFIDGVGANYNLSTAVAGTGATANTPASNSNWTSVKGHGVGVVLTGTSGTGRAQALGNANTSIVPGHGCMLIGASAGPLVGLPTGSETFSAFVGFNNLHSGTITDGYFWELRWNGSAAEIAATVVASSSYTRDTAGSPSPTSSRLDHFLVFVNSDASRADFFYSTDRISYVLASSVSSGLPSLSTSATVNACLGAQATAGSGSRGWYWDWAGLRLSGARI